MTVQYQSRFLRYWRGQVHHWQHQLEIQARRLQTSLKWTVQAWLYPLYRLVQVSHWLPSSVKAGIKHQWQRLQAQADPPPPPASDTALVNLIRSLEITGLTLTRSETSPGPTVMLKPPSPRPKSWLAQAWSQLVILGRRSRETLQPLFHRPVLPQSSPRPVLPAPEIQAPIAPQPRASQSPAPNPWQMGWYWLQAQIPKIPLVQLLPQVPDLSPVSANSALSTQTANLEITATPAEVTEPAKPTNPWAWLKQFATQARTQWQHRSQIIQPIQTFLSTALGLPPSSHLADAPGHDVHNLAVGATELSHAQPEPTAVIQGVACQLENRHLVLVTVTQEILDILTPQQQHQLAERILWELAGYYYQVRQWQKLTGHGQPAESLAAPTPSEVQSLPVGLAPLPLAPNLSLNIAELWQRLQAWLWGWPSLSGKPKSLSLWSSPIRSIMAQTKLDATGLTPTSNVSSAGKIEPPRPSRQSSQEPQLTRSPGMIPSGPLTIDIASTFLGYEPEGLDIFWLWLDRLFLWLERAWAWVWGLGVRLVSS